MLCLSRPALFERRRRLGSREEIHQRIELSPLGTSDMGVLAGELLQKDGAESLPTLRALIVGRAEGNPFYMEELVKMLIDQGAIDTAGDVDAAPGQGAGCADSANADGRVAGPARRTAQARAAGVAASQRDRPGVLGSGIGRAQPSGTGVPARAGAARAHAAAAGAALDDVREYAFSHQILHHVTYGTLLKRTKRALHARVAAWLAGLQGARANDFLGIHCRAVRAGRRQRASKRILHPRRRTCEDALCPRCGTARCRPGPGAAGSRRRVPNHPQFSTCAGGCWSCANTRWACRAGATEQRARSRRWRRWPTRLTTTGDARLPRGGAACWECARPTTACRKAPPAGRWRWPNAPATWRRVSKLSGWSPTRWVSRASSRPAKHWRSRAWPRRAPAECAAPKASSSTRCR